MYNLGLIDDPRSEEEKAKDYQSQEVFGSSPIVWREKPQSEWKKYSIRNQDGSSSCVAQATAKALEVMKGDVWSAHPLYRRRANFPQEGMWLQNLGDILKKEGTTTEALDPSQNMSEELMNKDVTVDTPEKGWLYFFVDGRNIDAIAEQVEKRPLLICFNLHHGEWKDIPEVIPNSERYNGHCVTVVDYTLWNGQKALIIDDSWGNATTLGNGGQRIITEAYLKERVMPSVMYFLPKPDLPEKPIHTFNINMVYGDKNEEVEWLQKCLIHEGLMKPALVTGYFGIYTLRAVMAFQEKYRNDILKPLGMGQPSGKCLKYTRNKLNSLYSS